MGIMDLLNPKVIEADKSARSAATAQAQADPAAVLAGATPVEAAPAPVPAVIPIGTPAPAVTLAKVASDKQARLNFAEFAAQNPDAAMAGATPYPAPPKPKLIPIGTPSPAVTPEEVAADREARRLAMESMKNGLGGAPVDGTAAPAPAVAPVATPNEQVPPIMQQAQLPPEDQKALSTAADAVDQAQAKGEPTEKAEATFAEKLKAIAKKTGQGILDILQAAAYGYAGVNKQTRLETQVATDAQEKKDLLDHQWQMQMQKITQDFQSTQARMDRDFSLSVSQAKNDWEVQAAKDAYAQQSKENELDRQNSMNIAKEAYKQQTATTLDQINQLIQARYGAQ